MDIDSYLRCVLALAFVLGLMFALAWVMRRFMAPGLVRPRGALRRLTIVESLALDPKRRLILVRRDGREHLLLVGGATDLLVEGGISAPEAATEAATDAGSPASSPFARMLKGVAGEAKSEAEPKPRTPAPTPAAPQDPKP
jgi:flagellar protein FliO/FliZ